MRHLSVRTPELPRDKVITIACPYQMGDEFVETVAEVNCKSCLRQIKKLQAVKV